ncbi:MAG TPA: branched-chain amino acid ABC transporter permease, partial [Aeromicrobium sp.]|nr:branched-chain amino acid ABC transporter permease [Aeromicrobium sp.]
MRLRLAAIFALFMGATLALGFSPAGAAEGDPTTAVSGRLVNASDNQAPVPGVTINVTAGDGTSQSVITDSDGRYKLDVPALGETTIAIDTSTFPSGVSMGEGSPSELKVVLDFGRPVFTPIFSVGQGEVNTNTWVDRVPQIVYQGLYFGLILALGSLGLSMIYGTTGLSNFAHGELVTFGAIVAYTFNVTLNMNIWISAVAAVGLSAAFGFVQDTLFWRKLRKRGTGLIALMIVSIGLQFLLRNIFQFFTGGRTLNYNEYTTPAGIELGPIIYSNRDLVLMGIAIVLLAIAIIGLQRTRIGRATRAIADNPALSASTGINVDRV